MRYELIHMLQTMNNPTIIKKLLKSTTLDERETISQLLSYVSSETKNKWEPYL